MKASIALIDVLLSRIKELVCVSADGKPLFGKDMDRIHVLKNHSVAITNGLIIDIGPSDIVDAKYAPKQVIDCSNKVITPGFVDPHTHPVFVHSREEEFEMRILGKTYVEISQSGGGILSTIATTREASEETLYELAKKRLLKMLEQGTTTVEIKSGYGLTTESELKQLRVIRKLAETLQMDIVPTFLGAHEFPVEYKNDHKEYIRILCDEMLPAVAEQGIAEYCDIFTEAHVYDREESREVLTRARELGLKLKMHADEIEPTGGAELAAEMNCASADHLGMTSDEGILALKEAGVIPVLLPATLFSLGKSRYARAKDMMEAGLPVALATDFNAGSCSCDSMPFVMTLACLMMKMTPAQSLAACTINAAAAINRQSTVGSLTVGKQANILIWDIPSYKFIPYHIGSSHLEAVLVKGHVLVPGKEYFNG